MTYIVRKYIGQREYHNTYRHEGSLYIQTRAHCTYKNVVTIHDQSIGSSLANNSILQCFTAKAAAFAVKHWSIKLLASVALKL